MDRPARTDYSIYVNGQNPVLSTDEIETIAAFFRIFENEHQRASLPAMTQSIANMEEFNTEIVRRVLNWMAKHADTPCELSRCGLPHLHEANNAAADAVRHKRESTALFRADQQCELTRTAAL